MKMWLKQEVNLYQTTNAPGMSVTWISRIWIACLTLLVAILIFQKEKLKQENISYYELLKQERVVQAKLKNLSLDLKNNQVLVRSQEAVESTKKEIEQSQVLLAQIKSMQTQKNTKLSGFLKDLSVQQVHSARFSVIHIKSPELKIYLSGTVNDPTLIPVMMDAWQHAPSFADIQFKKIALQKTNTQPSTIQFDIQIE